MNREDRIETAIDDTIDEVFGLEEWDADQAYYGKLRAVELFDSDGSFGWKLETLGNRLSDGRTTLTVEDDAESYEVYVTVRERPAAHLTVHSAVTNLLDLSCCEGAGREAMRSVAEDLLAQIEVLEQHLTRQPPGVE